MCICMVCTHTQAASMCGVCQPCVYNSEYTGSSVHVSTALVYVLMKHTHTTHQSQLQHQCVRGVCVVSTHTHGVKTSVCGVCS